MDKTGKEKKKKKLKKVRSKAAFVLPLAQSEMQDVCIERSQPWGLKNLLLPLFLSWEYSVSYPCTSSQKLFKYFPSQWDWTRTPHSVSEPPPPTRHQPRSLKGSERRCLFQPRDSLPGGIQAALVGGERGNPDQRDQSEKRLRKGRAWGSRWFLPVGYFVDKNYTATQSARHEPANGKAFPVGPVIIPIPSSYTISLRFFS